MYDENFSFKVFKNSFIKGLYPLFLGHAIRLR